VRRSGYRYPGCKGPLLSLPPPCCCCCCIFLTFFLLPVAAGGTSPAGAALVSASAASRFVTVQNMILLPRNLNVKQAESGGLWDSQQAGQPVETPP
jgi:hypothetical protein